MRTTVRVIAIAGAAIVIGSLFLHWYRIGIGATGTSPNAVAQSGWTSFHHGDIALTAMAGSVVVLAVLSFFVPRRALMVAIGVLGVAAVALIVRHIASPPQSTISVDVGAYLGLAGAAIVAVAGVAGLGAGTKHCPACAKAAPLAPACHHEVSLRWSHGCAGGSPRPVD